MEVDIKNRVFRDFGTDAQVAIGLIEAFESKLKLSHRITRCVVYLANGNINELKKCIREAEIDWRDVILYTEKSNLDFNKPFD